MILGCCVCQLISMLMRDSPSGPAEPSILISRYIGWVTRRATPLSILPAVACLGKFSSRLLSRWYGWGWSEDFVCHIAGEQHRAFIRTAMEEAGMLSAWCCCPSLGRRLPEHRIWLARLTSIRRRLSRPILKRSALTRERVANPSKW